VPSRWCDDRTGTAFPRRCVWKCRSCTPRIRALLLRVAKREGDIDIGRRAVDHVRRSQCRAWCGDRMSGATVSAVPSGERLIAGSRTGRCR
jgi:hypothetical protein